MAIVPLPIDPFKTLVEDIHQFHNCGGDVKWNYIFREVNHVVYGLAKHGFNFGP
jgi:hypothetical protein